MREYRVVYRAGVGALLWQVQDADGAAVAYGFTQPRAERIARALAVLDAMEERDTQITEAMQDMAEDEPAVPQARGEG